MRAPDSDVETSNGLPPWQAQFSQRLGTVSSRLDEALDRHRERARLASQSLTDRVQDLKQQLVRQQAALHEREQQLSARRQDLETQLAELRRHREQFDLDREQQRRSGQESHERQQRLARQLKRQQEKLAESLAELTDRQHQLEHAREQSELASREQTSREERLRAEQLIVERLREEAEKRQLRLASELASVERRAARTEAQRRSIGRSLKARRNELRRSSKPSQSGPSQEVWQAQITELQQQLTAARDELTEACNAHDRLVQQLDASRRDASHLGEQSALLQQELDALQRSAEHSADELQQQSIERAAADQTALDQLQAQVVELQQDLLRRDEELRAAKAAMHADAAATHDAEQQRLERITSLESEVGRLQQALSQAEAEHAAQRLANERSVAESAEQLQQQIGSLQDEVARLHAALQAADAEQQAARLAAEQQAAEAARLAEQHAAQLSALQQESELLRLAQEEADQCRSEAERLAEQLRGEAEEARAEMHRAKVFADRIASTAEDEVREKVNALEDALADLAAKNEQLTHEIDGLKRKPAASVGSADSLTWEERKRLVLSQLEDEDQQDSEGRGVSERMSMRQLIEKTDREMARKEREISELQQLLEQQADTINHANQEVAVGAAAFAQIFDQDEIIRRERERLQSLQKEWEGKLREAEIDVSRERAKLSRERNELEEKQRDLQDQLRGVVREAEPNDGEPGANKSAQRGGRWFSKLGLNDRP